MSYAVQTTGSLLLPTELERQALTVLEVELASRQGPFDDSQQVDDLATLARSACAEVRRDGDWLQLGTVEGGDPQWSDQATAFYVGLGRWVHQGEAHFVGQDGARWSYRYGPDGVIQVGQNGWDGSLVPFGEPVSAGSTSPVAAGSTAPAAAGRANRSPAFLALVFLVGLVLVVGVAILASGF